MKLMLLAAVAFAGLMEEANDGTTGSSGGAATESKPAEPAAGIAEGDISQAELDTADAADKQAPDVADTSGDAPGQPAGAHLDAPAAANSDPVDPLVIEPGKTVALVTKGCDKIPVQLRDAGHLEALKHEHGAGAVEVQS